MQCCYAKSISKNKWRVIALRLYISGPMTGLPALNYPAFYATADVLTRLGHFAINPANGVTDDDNATQPWGYFMLRSLRILRDSAVEALVILPGWEQSRGARIEIGDAIRRGLMLYRLIGDTLHPVPMSEIRPGLLAMTEEDFEYLHQDIDSLAG